MRLCASRSRPECCCRGCRGWGLLLSLSVCEARCCRGACCPICGCCPACCRTCLAEARCRLQVGRHAVVGAAAPGSRNTSPSVYSLGVRASGTSPRWPEPCSRVRQRCGWLRPGGRGGGWSEGMSIPSEGLAVPAGEQGVDYRLLSCQRSHPSGPRPPSSSLDPCPRVHAVPPSFLSAAASGRHHPTGGEAHPGCTEWVVLPPARTSTWGLAG